MNHTRLLKEVHLPGWARWDKHGKKGDRVEVFLKILLVATPPPHPVDVVTCGKMLLPHC
jgi:hypothetical protein